MSAAETRIGNGFEICVHPSSPAAKF